jgi:hypothetical protein
LRDRRVRWDVDRMGKGLWTVQIMLIICYQIELDKLNIFETLHAVSLRCVGGYARDYALFCLTVCLFTLLHYRLRERNEWMRKCSY